MDVFKLLLQGRNSSRLILGVIRRARLMKINER